MSSNAANRGVSKSEWFQAALEALAEDDRTELSVEALAQRLGIAKSGFYWHFANRKELIDQLLQHWMDESVRLFQANDFDCAIQSVQQLVHATQAVLDPQYAKFEAAIQQWAKNDPEVARAVEQVNRLRLDCFFQALEQNSVSPDEAEVRAYLYLCLISGHPRLGSNYARIASKELIPSHIRFLTQSEEVRS